MAREFVVPPHTSDPTRYIHEAADRSANHPDPVSLLRDPSKLRVGSTERRSQDIDVAALADHIRNDGPFGALAEFIPQRKSHIGRDRAVSHDIGPGRSTTAVLDRGNADVELAIDPDAPHGIGAGLDVEGKAKALPTELLLGAFGSLTINSAAIDQWRDFVIVGSTPARGIERGLQLG